MEVKVEVKEEEEDGAALWAEMRLEGSALQAAAAAAAWARAAPPRGGGPALALTLLATETNTLLRRLYGDDDALVLAMGL